MKCPRCNNEMHIVAQFFQVGATPAGLPAVQSVMDFQCMDPQCANGKKKIPTARETLVCESDGEHKDAVRCCGAPVAYVGKRAYWIPDGVAFEETDGLLRVGCPQCGEAKEIDVTGKTSAR